MRAECPHVRYVTHRTKSQAAPPTGSLVPAPSPPKRSHGRTTRDRFLTPQAVGRSARRARFARLVRARQLCLIGARGADAEPRNAHRHRSRENARKRRNHLGRTRQGLHTRGSQRSTSPGPASTSVTQLNPNALEEAKKADKSARRASEPRAADAGVPILLKDIIDATPMYTSAGDWALRESFPEKDSGVAKQPARARRGHPRQARPVGVGEQLRQPAVGLQQPDRPGPERERRGRGAERLLLRLGRGRPQPVSSTLTIGTETAGSIISPSTAEDDRRAETDARPRARLRHRADRRLAGHGGPDRQNGRRRRDDARIDRRGAGHRPRSERRVSNGIDGSELPQKRRHPAGAVHDAARTTRRR